MTYTCACYPTDGRDAGAGPGAQVRPGRRASSAWSPGMRLLDVGLRLGRHGAARRRATTASRVTRRHPLPGAGHLGPGADQGRSAWTTWPRCGTSDYRDVREPDFDAVSSIGLIEHIGVQQLRRRTSGSCGTSCVPAADCSTTASPGRTTSTPGCRPARLHRPLRVPGRRAHRLRRHRARGRGRRPRGAAPGEPAGALRPHAGGLVRQPRRRTGTSASPTPACRSPRCGASTWPARGSGSSATGSSCTRSWPPAPADDGASGYPLRHDFGV